MAHECSRRWLRTTGLLLLVAAARLSSIAAEEPHGPASPPRTDARGDPLPEGAIARLGTLRWHHEGCAESVAFSSDGKLVATSTRDGSISLFETASGKRLGRLRPESEQDEGLVAIAFSPAGRYLAAQAIGGHVLLWDTRSWKPAQTLATSPDEPGVDWMRPPASLAFSRDGKRLAATTTNEKVVIWDVASGERTAEFDTGERTDRHLAFLPDGKTLAVTGRKSSIQLWDAAGGQLLRGTDSDGEDQHSLAISPDGKTMASGGSDCIRLFETTNCGEVGRFKAEMGYVCDLAFTPDGMSLVSVSTDAGIRIWNFDSRTAGLVRGSVGWKIPTMALSPDGRTVVMGTEYPALRLWDVKTREELFPYTEQHFGSIWAVAFSPDGRLLVTTETDCQLHLWDGVTAKHRAQHEHAGGSCLSFSPDGQRLAVAMRWKCDVSIRNVAAANIAVSLSTDAVEGIAFLLDGKSVVTLEKTAGDWPHVPSNLNLCTRDLPTGEVLQCFTVPYRQPQCLAISTSSRWVALGGNEDPPLLLCDRERGRIRFRLSRPKSDIRCVAFSPDERVLAAGDANGWVRWREVRSGQPVLARKAHQCPVASIAFSPDGRRLASADGESERDSPKGEPPSICLWDVRTGRKLISFIGHDSHVTSLAFSPDGKRLVSGHLNGTTLIWDVGPRLGPPPASFEDVTARDLDVLWKDLAGADAARAYRAVQKSAAAHATSVTFLQARLRPAEQLNQDSLKQWLANLDHDDFFQRESASQALRCLGSRIEPLLWKELGRASSAEKRRRLQELLDQVDLAVTPEALREWRAVWVLEQAATAPAHQLLRNLAEGAADAPLTQEARAALARLDKKP